MIVPFVDDRIDLERWRAVTAANGALIPKLAATHSGFRKFVSLVLKGEIKGEGFCLVSSHGSMVRKYTG